MYGYNSPYYNQQYYQQDLMNMRDRIDKQLQQYQTPQQQVPTNLTQNFQLAPNNTGIKYVNNVEEVKKELVFTDTLYPTKDYKYLFLKNAKGEIKTFELNEIIEKDEKDLLIDKLQERISMLEKEKNVNESNTNDSEYVDEQFKKQKSTNSKSNK